MDWLLAVDFGTSNTTAAVTPVDSTDVTVLRLSDDADHMPSAVLVSGDAENTATIYVGQGAQRQATLYPDRFVPDPKTYLGGSNWDFGPFQVPIRDLVAAIFLRVLRRAREFVDGEVVDVVLTHPADWETHRLAELRRAAREAGLGEVELLPEPIAAAARYAAAEKARGPVGVFDFGAGTCDVAVLERIGRDYTVLAQAGEPLGGNDVDAAMIQSVLAELSARSDAASVELAEHLATEPRSSEMMILRESVQQAKHHLSEYPHAPVRVGNSVVTVTSDQLDTDAMPVVDRTVDLLERVLGQAGFQPTDLPVLYLTGGSSRLRPVGRRITELLETPPHLQFDPKTVVVAGALHHIRARTAPGSPPSPEPASSPNPVTSPAEPAPTVTARPASPEQVRAAQTPDEPYSIATDKAYAALFRREAEPPRAALPLTRNTLAAQPEPRHRKAPLPAETTRPAATKPIATTRAQPPPPSHDESTSDPLRILGVIVVVLLVAAGAAWLGRQGAMEFLGAGMMPLWLGR